MNEGMRANQEVAMKEAAARDKELAELNEQIRDLMFFMSARDKIEQGESGEELKDGSVQAVPPSSSNAQHAGSSGRRRRRK